MKVLCYNIEENLMESIGLKFLPLGFQFYPTNSDFELKKVLYSKGVRLIIADISDNKNKEGINLEFLEWLKSVDQNNSFKKIVLSKINDEYNIKRLMELGITSFISKKNQTSVILTKIEGSLTKMNIGKPDARKDIRIAPDKSDNPSAMFYLGQDKIVSNIVNISVGGILLQAENTVGLNQIRKDSELSRIQITLNNKKIIANAIVVAKKDNFIGLKYSSMSDVHKEVLSKYIFHKISHI